MYELFHIHFRAHVPNLIGKKETRTNKNKKSFYQESSDFTASNIYILNNQI